MSGGKMGPPGGLFVEPVGKAGVPKVPNLCT